jgi:two-component system phosphate regulon sensor histidine kinase PhoR
MIPEGLIWGATTGAVAGAAVAAAVATMLARRRSPKVEPPPPARAAPADRMEGAFVRLARALPIGIVVVDASRRIEFANPAAGAIFGFDLDRAAGSHIIEAVPNVEIEDRIADALDGEASVAPLSLGGRDGGRVYRLSVYPLPDDDGAIERVVVLADDQTALTRLERARREFLSNVSHELRTPLSSIKLMLETVVASPDDEARDLFLPQALQQVDRLAALVGQLLEQARAESGQLKLSMRQIDLEEVAHPIISSFEPQAASKGVDLELVTLRPVEVEADPDRLSQVFVNLIDNALRHTRSGGRIAIELDARGSDAVVRIRDTGEGIPYRDVPRIFERFYVVDRSRQRESSGAGLGLAIVKGIVDAHGGAISAESTVGRGTTFTIRLPIVRIKRDNQMNA